MLRNVLTVLCVIGSTLAATGSANAEVMCAKLTNGKLRMAPFCKSTERQIAEKQVSTTTTTVLSCDLIDSGVPGVYVAVATCPAGTVMTGGGGECSVGSLDDGSLTGGVLFLSEMLVDSDGAAWLVGCDTFSLGNPAPIPTLCASATCATTTMTP
jgi:hypothetical protein